MLSNFIEGGLCWVRLRTTLFKEEETNGIYRAHFIVNVRGLEVTRFAVEFKEKPSREELTRKVERMIEKIARNLPPLPERLVIEKDVD